MQRQINTEANWNKFYELTSAYVFKILFSMHVNAYYIIYFNVYLFISGE